MTSETDEPPHSWGEVISAETFLAAGFDSAVANHSSIDALKISRALEALARDIDDEAQKRVLGVASSIMQMMPRLRRAGDPYGPMWEMDGRRSLIPTDFQGRQRDELERLLPNLQHPAVLARVADLCWLLRRRSTTAAIAALHAYSTLLDRIGIDADRDYLAANFIDRGLQICRAIGADQPAAATFIAAVDALLERTKEPRAYRRLAASVLHHRHDMSKRLADRLSALLQEADVDDLTEQDCQDFLVQAYRRAGDDDAVQAAMSAGAECSFRAAEIFGSGMGSAHWYRDAMKRFRRIPGKAERAEEAERRYKASNTDALSELSSFSHEVDVTDEVENIKKLVSQPTWKQAARAFALLGRSPEPDEVLAQAMKLARDSPLSAIVPSEIYDSDGLVVARSSGLGLTGAPEDADAMKFYIARQESVRRTMSGQMLSRARIHIAATLDSDYEFIRWVVQTSPFVPDEKARTFQYGFARYFEGDLTGASYVLVPQIEASLRYLIAGAGGDVVTTKADGTQTPAALGRLLTMLRAMEPKVIPDGILDEIDHLFDYPAGPRLRHSFAHGQQSDDAIFSFEVEYALWFMWHLTVLPLLPYWPKDTDND